MARIGRNPMVIAPFAHEADDPPMLLGERDGLLARGALGEALGPVRRLDEVTLAVDGGQPDLRRRTGRRVNAPAQVIRAP